MIVTRIAPSPTGFLHIGNARTAIFNYLIAKHYGGKMLLRIEDTDTQRSTPEAVEAIFTSLQFLNIQPDHEPVFQSNNKSQHQKLALALLEAGYAYKCFHTPEEVDAIKSSSSNQPFRSQYRECSQNTENPDKPYVVRFKIPEGQTTFTDTVQNSITVNNNTIEDFVLLRSDGSPTYLLAVVADDHNMGVNWIIRGSDHITNTFKQLQIIHGMGWKVPKYSHIPLIHDKSGKKLSKRNGSVGVLDFAKDGILPEALFNYLMRLGWGHKDEEFIPFNQAVQIFTEKGFGKAAAKFDDAKLLDLSGKHMRHLDNQTLLLHCQNYQQKYLPDANEANYLWNSFEQGLDCLKIRCKTLREIIEMGRIFLLDEAPQVNETSEHADQLCDFVSNAMFDETLGAQMREFCQTHEISFGKAAKWMRFKITGLKVSPSLFEVMQVLGKEATLNRLAS